MWNFLVPVFRPSKEHRTPAAPMVNNTFGDGMNPYNVPERATAACEALGLLCNRLRLSTCFTNVTRFKFESHERCHGFESGDP